jgi:hypothetical protein
MIVALLLPDSWPLLFHILFIANLNVALNLVMPGSARGHFKAI